MILNLLNTGLHLKPLTTEFEIGTRVHVVQPGNLYHECDGTVTRIDEEFSFVDIEHDGQTKSCVFLNDFLKPHTPVPA